MAFGLAYWKRGLPLTAVLWMAVYPLQAQHGGQPITFSSPASDDAVSPLPLLSSKSAEAPDLGDSAQVPLQFNFNGSSRAAPRPVVSSAAVARSQDLLDQRNNWLLLTPAEILGQTTPEKKMGIPERDAFGQRKYSSAMERYAARQSPASSKTNASQMDYPSVLNFPDDRNGVSNSINGGWGNPDKPVNPLFNPVPDNQILSRQDGNSGWTKLFNQPAQPPVPGPAQLTDMDRFRQMLNSGSPATAPAATPAMDGIKTSLPQTLLAQPQPGRIGASYVPLNSGIGKPADLPRLSGAWSLNYTSAPPAAAWAPQVAPWLSPAPQPFAVPQRKF